MARVYQDEAPAIAVVHHVKNLAHLFLAPAGQTLADLAAQIAARHRLRGSDAVCGAVARRYNSTLVTLDTEQQPRAASVVTTKSPAQALADLDTQNAE